MLVTGRMGACQIRKVSRVCTVKNVKVISAALDINRTNDLTTIHHASTILRHYVFDAS